MGGIFPSEFSAAGCHTHAIRRDSVGTLRATKTNLQEGFRGSTSPGGRFAQESETENRCIWYPDPSGTVLPRRRRYGSSWWCESPQPGLKESAFPSTVRWLSLTLVGSRPVRLYTMVSCSCSAGTLSLLHTGPHTIFYRYFRGCVKGHQFWPGKGSGFLH